MELASCNLENMGVTLDESAIDSCNVHEFGTSVDEEALPSRTQDPRERASSSPAQRTARWVSRELLGNNDRGEHANRCGNDALAC